jgi:hypothetical protein
MIAGPPQRLAAPARGEPADGGENQKDLFVGAPGQGSRISSGAGVVSRAIARAIATSALVGRTVIGKLGPRRRRLGRILAVRMAQGSGT